MRRKVREARLLRPGLRREEDEAKGKEKEKGVEENKESGGGLHF